MLENSKHIELSLLKLHLDLLDVLSYLPTQGMRDGRETRIYYLYKFLFFYINFVFTIPSLPIPLKYYILIPSDFQKDCINK